MINEETDIVMCYTGWTQETAAGAIAQWRAGDPDWSAEYIKRYLSAQTPKRLTTEADDA